ncbi:MAG: PAS domain-containing protein [Prosthecobacter sp.]
MSSSVLQNVIQPKAHTSPLAKLSAEVRQRRPHGALQAEDFETNEGEDMELVLGVLVENAPVAMAMFDRGMRYMLANRQWITEFGLQQVQPLVGKSQYEIFPGLHPGWRQVYERALQGHIVRSEHDSLSGPDGRPMVYRWEVRPWRKKRDASVGGLMVTCEKFRPLQDADSETAENDAETTRADGTAPRWQPEPFECSVPMIVLDGAGIIQRANAAAARLALEKGIHEGSSSFWEVFGKGRDRTTLRQQVVDILETAATADRAPILDMPERTEADADMPARWVISSLRSKGSDEANRHFMLMGLPTDPGMANVTQVSFQMPVQATPTPAPPPVEDSDTVARLEDQLSRARQELRTLTEAQQAFTLRETRLRHYFEAIPCGLFVLDERGSPLFQNEHLARLLGRPLERTSTIEEWLAAACPTEEHREQVVSVWRESIWRRQLTRTLSLATSDGLLKELEFHPIGLPNGGLLVSIQDVTEFVRHEEQLRGMEAKMRVLLQGSPVAVVLTDKTGVIFEVNHHAEELLGQAKAELRRFPLDAWLDPQSATARRDALRLLKHGGQQSEALGIRVKRADGTFANVILHLAAVLDAQGDVHCTVHYLQEEAPSQPAMYEPALEAPRTAVSTAPVRTETARSKLLNVDANGRVRSWSEAAERLFDVGADDAVRRPLHLFFRPSDATGFFAELLRQSASPETYVERPFYGANGKRGSVKTCVRQTEDGGFEMMIEVPGSPAPTVEASVQEQPVVVANRQRSVAYQVVSPSSDRWPVFNLERENLLLTETHHRIKNHLQIISSLLNLQINGVSDQDARDALRCGQNRVRAIASLHQHLYQVALGKGDTFNDFVRDLVAHLRECYEIPSHRVHVRLEIAEAHVQPEWLMPLALTLNEALSNCFEHAFPHDRQGQISVALNYAESSGELVISDDGVGLPEGYNPGEGNGLGLKILAVFAEQMRGQLFVRGTADEGTEIKLRFPLAAGGAR